MNTCLSGRILQIKNLVASKYVYTFQLLPTPFLATLNKLDKLYFDYLWDNGRHRISKLNMLAPHSQGGFNMLDVYSQEQSLKIVWINRLLGDTNQITMWCAYICSAFLIPITDALRCNLDMVRYKILLCKVIPPVWHSIFAAWYKMNYISHKCSDKNRKQDMLNVLACFNQAIRKTRKITGAEMVVYTFLAHNNILTLYELLCNLQNITKNLVGPNTHVLSQILLMLCSVPDMWKEALELEANYSLKDMEVDQHIMYSCIEGKATAKQFYQKLVAKKYTMNDKAITQWTVDLGISDLPLNWSKVAKAGLSIRNTYLQDFFRSFLHRSYWTNIQVCKFEAGITKMCTFCDKKPESYLHLF